MSKDFVKNIILGLILFSSASTFASNCKMFIPTFEIKHPEGTDHTVIERERKIAGTYKKIIESELSIKGYTVQNLSNFDFNGTAMGVNLEGYDKTPSKCLFTLHLREFKTFDVIGAPATELVSEKYFFGKSSLGLFPKKRMPDCSKALAKAVLQIEYCN